MLEVEDWVLEKGRGVPTNHINVGGADGGGVHEGHNAGDHAAPVAALGDVVRIAEAEHEFVACFGVLGQGEAAFGDGGGETEVGKGRGDDVEGGGGGRGEEGEDFGHFEEGAGPCYGWESVIVIAGVETGDSHPWQKRSGMAPSMGDCW